MHVSAHCSMLCSRALSEFQVSRGTVEFGGEHHDDLLHSIPGVRQTLPLVHSGFWGAYCTVRAQLKEVLIEALREAGPGARLFFTGHSLGGALASLAALDLGYLVSDNRTALNAFSGA